MEVPEGLTVAEIVAVALPDVWEPLRDRLRVVLVSAEGEAVLAVEIDWRRVRPKPGVMVLIRVVPAGDDLKSVLLIAVSIAAVAAGQFWIGPALAGVAGLSAGTWAAVATAGITLLGSALINWLLPPSPTQGEKPNYAISAWKNSATPNGQVPVIFGVHRYAPPYGGRPYIEIIGDDMFIRGLFVVGLGEHQFDDPRLGDTPLANFDEVEVAYRYGTAVDPPLSIYTQQVVEEQVGTELVRDRPRDDAGNIVPGDPGIASPVTRISAGDATEVNLIFNFPGGLVQFDKKGKALEISVAISIRLREAGEVTWGAPETLTFTGKSREGMWRQHRFTLPSRGRWDIEITRTTDERINDDNEPDGKVSDRVVWFAVQSFRPESPINVSFPLATVELRIRATHQLNGGLDTFNLIAKRIAPAWTGTAWEDGLTRNPAAAFRFALTSAANLFPQGADGLLDDELADWFEFCEAKGLKYDRVHDFGASLFEVLTDIARAGRASPRRDGNRWGVVIDRPRSQVVAHLNERNARDISWRRTFFTPPEGLRVTFLDETANYQTREMVIPWPDHVGDVEFAEELQMPGKTDYVEVYREAYRHMQAVMLRPDRFSAVQDGAVRTATRGDLVKANLESIVSTQASLRVKAVRGQHVEVDGQVTMEEGQSYAVRFFVVDEATNTWLSTLRRLTTAAGRTSGFALVGTGAVPDAGQLIQFGLWGSESFDLVVTGVEAGEDMTTVVYACAAAPEIDALTDAAAIPAWDGRVGDLAAADDGIPDAPRVTSVATHYTSGTADGLLVLLAPDPATTAPIALYQVQHRLVGAGAWSGPVAAAAGGGGVAVTGYVAGNAIEFQARVVSAAEVFGTWTATITATVASPAAAPGAVTSASVVAGLGFATVTMQAPPDDVFDHFVLYRGTTAVFGSAVAVAEWAGNPGGTYTRVEGDNTRTTKLTNGAFSVDANWTKGTGWTIASGKATKAAGTGSSLSEAASVTSGKTYRYGLTTSARSAGTVTPQLTGGSTVSGAAMSTNATILGSLVAASGNVTFGLLADAAFNGSIDDASLFEQTATCVPQGNFYYFLTAANDEGAESAPFALGPVTIV